MRKPTKTKKWPLYIKLTDEQMNELRPLFDQSLKEHARRVPGVILCQPSGPLDRHMKPGYLRVGFLTNEYATAIGAILDLRNRLKP